MIKDEALQIMKEHLKKDYMIKHSLAVAAIMKGVADCIKDDVELYETIGILHDIDFEKISKPEEHTIITEMLLKEKASDELIRNIKSHNFEHTKINPEKNVEHALIAADAISGLIVACALVMPSKKLSDVKLESLKEKFRSKEFARNCSREKILYCEKISIDRDKFFEISLNAMKGIADELGL
ncbi:MAG: HDIG domain-containing metalloprotein [Candidatus Aenigmatarchaeota archaeon]